MTRSIRTRAAALVTLATFVPGVAGVAVGATQGAVESLPAVSSGALPGPPVLYAPPPAAPQLENRDPRFRAEPLLVSGEEAYVDGEYLYQDFLYDDYGSDTDGVGGSSQRAQAGEVTYPTGPEYGGNAADLVEFRAAPGDDEVVYRFTLNTLLREDSTILALAFDTDRDAGPGVGTLPRDPGARFPGTDEVITVWGTGAEHSRLTAERAVTSPVPVHVDLEANQVTVTVPRSVSDPRGTWRATLATGLYDPATGGWKRPGVTATEDTPGGAGPADPAPNAIFNLGFRFDEPVLTSNVSPDTRHPAVGRVARRRADPVRPRRRLRRTVGRRHPQHGPRDRSADPDVPEPTRPRRGARPHQFSRVPGPVAALLAVHPVDVQARHPGRTDTVPALPRPALLAVPGWAGVRTAG
jgi:hypothetical protein